MSANTATSRDTPATQKHANAHGCTAGRGWGEGSWGPPILSSAGQAGEAGRMHRTHHVYTLQAGQERASTHGHMGRSRSVLCEREGWGGRGVLSPGQARDHPQGKPGFDGCRCVEGRQHTLSENMQDTSPRPHSGHTRADSSQQANPSDDVHDCRKLGCGRPLGLPSQLQAQRWAANSLTLLKEAGAALQPWLHPSFMGSEAGALGNTWAERRSWVDCRKEGGRVLGLQ